MVRKFLCVFPLLVAMSVLLPAAQLVPESKGITNAKNKRWQVRYHKDEKNPNSSNAVAIRLKIDPVTGSDTQITGKLTLYRSTTTNGAGNTIYDPSTKFELNSMTGQIDINQGENDNRKLQRFTLSESYMAGTEMRKVTVRGFHYTGRGKGKANRHDDQLIVRVKDLPTTRKAPVLHNCDEQPPDEDVLTEEDVPDMNPPDPDYDAGP